MRTCKRCGKVFENETRHMQYCHDCNLNNLKIDLAQRKDIYIRIGYKKAKREITREMKKKLIKLIKELKNES